MYVCTNKSRVGEGDNFGEQLDTVSASWVGLNQAGFIARHVYVQEGQHVHTNIRNH